MRPHDDIRNGDDKGAGSRPCSASGSEEGSGGEGEGALAADELSLVDDGAPARVLAALNALRKSRQHFDVLLVADGAEVPAHRAVLAAASPYLLEALQSEASHAVHRVEQVSGESLRTLVEYAYTGRLRVRDAGAARRLYACAWRLRVERVRTHLAARLVRILTPHDCLPLRALPDLAPDQLQAVDQYISDNFEEICGSGALNGLPVVNISMLRESSAEDGEETPPALADAALAWLRSRQPDLTLEELCSREHLLYVDARGELRDCGDLPASTDEAPELGQYRRQAAQRRRERGPVPAVATHVPDALGARVSKGAAGDWGVIAARAAGGGGTRALVVLRGKLAAARITWRAAGGKMTRGAVLGSTRGNTMEEAGERRAPMSEPRCALGAAVLEGKLIVCGGYDSARVLKTAESYDPDSNKWTTLPDMKRARARFPAARLGSTLYVLGGSDGHAELDSVDAFCGGAWKAKARLPLARGHAAAAAHEEGGAIYVVGGWAGGLSLRRVDKYQPDNDSWTEAPPLITGRSQCAGVLWGDSLWALGGCDTWHCLASTERLKLIDPEDGADWQWESAPPLPTARRSVGGVVWRGMLVSAGGSDGAASLRRVDWLLQPEATSWTSGPALRRPRAGLALAPVGDVLYAAGGFDGKQFLACVECLYQTDGEWTTLCQPPAISNTNITTRSNNVPLTPPHQQEDKQPSAN